ncbi:uncharacterized protein LOC128676182 [Plodia interpunctella]|uniref:uncharacterized protein LOC128676182 n=1 Tax=Plodia interpunctella TaxID=58824 RepID=UPI002368C8C7|nr:uncharacterized protein LOC128676182 [Plodia interpunctella]
MADTLLLIKSVEKHPCLYNHNSNEYLKKESADEAWNEVAKETKLTVTECKDKWRNLRYGFVRSLRINPDGSTKKKYYLHDEMAFVMPYLKFPNKPTPSYVYLQAGDVDSDEELIDNNPEFFQSPHEANDIEVNIEPPKKRAKLRNETHGNSTLLPNSLSSDNMENPRALFLLSLTPEIMELTEKQMKIFRRKVLALIDDITGNERHYVKVSNVHQDLNQFDNVSIKSEPL